MKEQQESQESMTDNHNMSASNGESGDGESGEGMEGFGEDSGEQEMKEILQDPFTSETETEESGGSESGESESEVQIVLSLPMVSLMRVQRNKGSGVRKLKIPLMRKLPLQMLQTLSKEKVVLVVTSRD